jgi:hypothetical protein
MGKFVVSVEWSQTDSTNYLVCADNRKQAEMKVREHLVGKRFRYICVREKIDIELL